MYYWRITKYNPLYRDRQGSYLMDEWTCYSDIGKSFKGKEFTIQEYLRTEESYIKAVMLFMSFMKLVSLRIRFLEHDGLRIKKYNDDGKKEIINNEYVQGNDLKRIIRLILRNVIWCRLEAEGMSLYFSHDLYMYITSVNPCNSVIAEIEKNGLFVESLRATPIEP
jgi:hypothetical protein